MKSEYGWFSEDGNEFIINTPQTPRHWYNYLWNDQYVSLFSQVGQGESLAQDKMGNRIELVKSRMLYIKNSDTGQVWGANGLPLTNEQNFSCIHGLGYSEITLSHNQIASKFRVFVPRHESCEIWTLKLKNNSNTSCNLQVFPYINAGLGGEYKPQAYYMSQGSFDSELNSVLFKTFQSFADSDVVYNFMTTLEQISRYDCRYESFIGYGTEQAPDAISNGCTNSETIMDKGILTIQQDITMKPDEAVELHFIIGTAKNAEEISITRQVYATAQAVEAEFEAVKTQIVDELGKTVFATADETLNTFSSIWLKRQIALGSQWARVRHNGYRDLIQDIGALACMKPDIALKHLERVLSYQYSNGYAPRTWLNGKILDKDFSDNHVWIPMTVHALIMETGDTSLLDHQIPFNDGSIATLYEHTKRSLDYLWNDRAKFGLCKIRSGDWNDCLESVGPKGKGVSVWLSMAFCTACLQFEELAQAYGKQDDLKMLKSYYDEMTKNIEQHCWDGRYYVRAFDDSGQVLGSHKNEQGTLYLNSQSWAVLAGLREADSALYEAEKQLDSDLGIRSVLNPYDHLQANIGSMSRKIPGVQENGGVYLHAAAFKLVADCMLKRHDKVEETIQKMLPFDHTYYSLNCEPYVFCNCYYATRNSYRYGTAGQSWGTGTAGWFYSALEKHVYGLKAELEGLRLDPCLPPSWKQCSIEKSFRNAHYSIHFDQTKGCSQIDEITVDGVPLKSYLLPYQESAKYKVFVTMS